MLSGTVFQLRPSVPLTAVTGSSPLLPTPRASLNELRTGKRTPSQEAGKHGRYLSSEVMRLLPTPCARDWKGEGYKGQLPTEMRLLPTPNASLCNYEEEPETWEPRRAAAAERHGNNGIGMPLPIALKLLPTPTSASNGNAADPERANERRQEAKAKHGRIFGPGLRRMRARVDRSQLSALGDGVHTYVGRLVGEYVVWLDKQARLQQKERAHA
jgi:hypothetical protein